MQLSNKWNLGIKESKFDFNHVWLKKKKTTFSKHVKDPQSFSDRKYLAKLDTFLGTQDCHNIDMEEARTALSTGLGLSL